MEKGIFLKFLMLEAFFGGSHRDFAEGLQENSRHEIRLATLPARFWKWRMRGAALHFRKRVPGLQEYHGLIATNMMSLSDFKAISGDPFPPSLVYFHENQLTYPLAPGEHRDFQFGFTDITTALAADRVLFNSHTHFASFFSALPKFIRMMPEFHPRWVTEEIREKSRILYPGCRFPAEPPRPGHTKIAGREPPLIIWNHRWEFDKNPGQFFGALEAVRARGIDFRLALLGENFQKVPKPFLKAREEHREQLVHYGYAGSREEYYSWLKRGDIVISTARQENFGIAVIEAVRHGCLPLLPKRLSYPEILPDRFHDDFLYKDHTDLVEKLCLMLTRYTDFRRKAEGLPEAVGHFSWEKMIHEYDRELERLVQPAKH